MATTLIPEPFTYYLNETERRVFLVADCPSPDWPDPEGVVALIEWGKTRREPVRLTVSAFAALIESGSLKSFIPSYK